MGLFLVQAGSSSSKLSAETVAEVGAQINFAFPVRLFSSSWLVQASSSCATTSKVPAGIAVEAISLAPVEN